MPLTIIQPSDLGYYDFSSRRREADEGQTEDVYLKLLLLLMTVCSAMSVGRVCLCMCVYT